MSSASTMKTKSALSYFGSDSEVAGELAEMLDHCKHVTIPFCGGMSILPHLKARAIVANDLNEFALNFYQVLSGVRGQDFRDELIRLCKATLSHPSEMENAFATLANPLSISYQKAWAYWAQCWVGRKGKGGTNNMIGMPSVRRTANGGTNASRIRAAASDLDNWATHLARCEFEQIDFRQLLPKIADNPECGIYLDPPWIGLGKDYLHPFGAQDHIDLCDLLRRFNHSSVVFRYGDHPMVQYLYSSSEWTIRAASSRTQSNEVKDEIWITKNLKTSD